MQDFWCYPSSSPVLMSYSYIWSVSSCSFCGVLLCTSLQKAAVHLIPIRHYHDPRYSCGIGIVVGQMQFASFFFKTYWSAHSYSIFAKSISSFSCQVEQIHTAVIIELPATTRPSSLLNRCRTKNKHLSP